MKLRLLLLIKRYQQYASHRLELFTAYVYDSRLPPRTNKKSLKIIQEGNNTTTIQSPKQNQIGDLTDTLQMGSVKR